MSDNKNSANNNELIFNESVCSAEFAEGCKEAVTEEVAEQAEEAKSKE